MVGELGSWLQLSSSVSIKMKVQIIGATGSKIFSDYGMIFH